MSTEEVLATRPAWLLAEVEKMRALGEVGAYVGRLNPMHLGHQALIRAMIEAFGAHHVVLVGSCNRPISLRHLFNYRDRVDFIRAVFPHARVVPLPDFEGDNASWFQAHDDLFQAFGWPAGRVVYIGGSREDTQFISDNGRTVHVVNRFTGPTVHVSASQVRDTLIGQQFGDGVLHPMLDPRVANLVRERFPARWNEVRSR